MERWGPVRPKSKPISITASTSVFAQATNAIENVGPVLVLGFPINLGVIIFGGAWKLSRLEVSLSTAIEKSRKEIDDRIEVLKREFGETNAAVRSKIHEVEIWARDNFMRRDGFYKVQEQLSSEIKTVRDEMKSDLRRIEEKIDTKT